MNQSAYPLTIYYDASCQLCNGEMTNLMLRNTQGLLAFVDASGPDFVSPIANTTRADLMSMIHAVQADGQVVRGVEVFRLAYSAVGLGWVTAPTAWPLLRQLADRAYPWVVRNRYRFPQPLVAWLFEGPTRRAAERAARQARCTEQTCER
jgi:predicted DCC family thiol-disulfide oxidoreductase YuxK